MILEILKFKLPKNFITDPGIGFNLQNCRNSVAPLNESFKLEWIKIAHANGFH